MSRSWRWWGVRHALPSLCTILSGVIKSAPEFVSMSEHVWLCAAHQTDEGKADNRVSRTKCGGQKSTEVHNVLLHMMNLRCFQQKGKPTGWSTPPPTNLHHLPAGIPACPGLAAWQCGWWSVCESPAAYGSVPPPVRSLWWTPGLPPPPFWSREPAPAAQPVSSPDRSHHPLARQAWVRE